MRLAELKAAVIFILSEIVSMSRGQKRCAFARLVRLMPGTNLSNARIKRDIREDTTREISALASRAWS